MFYAQVVKLVDTLASGASLRKKVEVQVLSWAPFTLFMPAQKTVGTPGPQAKLVRVRLRLKRCFNNAYLTLSWAPIVLPNRFGCKACHRRLNAGPGLEPKEVRQLAQQVATSGTAAKPPQVVKIAPRLA
jgi:hypothetical protein